ncbi:MAG: aldehyde dehydrogenase family protein [Knoellia sp.]
MTTTDESARSASAQPLPTEDARNALDAAIATVQAGERRWAGLGLTERVALLGRVHAAVASQAEQWVAAAVRAKNLDPNSPLVGEEWLSGPYCTMSGLQMLQHSLSALVDGKSPVATTKFGAAPGGRVAVPVLPTSPYEYLLLHGFSADVWMKPGIGESAVRATAGLGALTPKDTGGVGLVLGAGNITSIAPLDVLYELIAHNRVVVLKLNPTMNELLPVYTAAFAPLIELGLLAVVTGGGDVGAYLTQHAGIAHVHITGSAVTHDVIVWGPGAQGAARRESGTPVLDKPITSELGGVSPIIVVPGEWSAADLTFQAQHVATQRLHNGGYNCIAGQVVVLSEEWPQREAFVAELRKALEAAPERVPWYPGSEDRVTAASTAYAQADHLGKGGGRLLVDTHGGVSAAAIETTEYFAPVLGIVDVPGTGRAFLDAAIEHANTALVGTLGANIIIAPATLKELGNGFDESLVRLEYGTIAVNAWTGVGFLTAGAPWGAFPGHTLADVQSGIGIVHNAFLLEDTERTVVRGPFRPFPRSFAGGEFSLSPKPPWFVSARSARRTGQLLTRFAAKPSWAKLPGIFASAFRA